MEQKIVYPPGWGSPRARCCYVPGFGKVWFWVRGGGGAGVVSSNGLMVVRDRSMFVPVEGVVVAKESRRISELVT